MEIKTREFIKLIEIKEKLSSGIYNGEIAAGLINGLIQEIAKRADNEMKSLISKERQEA